MPLLRNKIFVGVLPALCLLFSCAVGCLGASIDTPNFRIVYDKGNEDDARAVAGYAENWLSKSSFDLGSSGSAGERRVVVHVFGSRPDFVKETGSDRKTFVVGRAWSAGHSHRIEIDASGTFSRIETVVAHEVTHVVIARILGDKITSLPLWANEGIARIESGESGPEDAEAIGEAISIDHFIPLDQIDEKFPKENERAGLAYAEGTSFMEFIRTKIGQDGLKKLLTRVSQTGDFDGAVIELAGRPFSQLQAAWIQSVTKSYSTNWIYRTLWAFTGIAMALLCLAAYKAVQRKRRWNHAKWLIEESYYDAEPLDYGDPED
jgi:hypothetical protein